jgi:uncharacterized lipoprotein YajG
MKILTQSTIACIACFLLAGCQTPEERMERAMNLQMQMMQRMQTNMAAMETSSATSTHSQIYDSATDTTILKEGGYTFYVKGKLGTNVVFTAKPMP